MSEILRAGPRRKLLWGEDSSERLRGKQYYESLKSSDRAKFDALFNRMAEGRIVGKERFRKESGDIYVFKIFKHRLACFYEGDDVVIINRYVKTPTTTNASAATSIRLAGCAPST